MSDFPVIRPLPTDLDISDAIDALREVCHWLDQQAPERARAAALTELQRLKTKFGL